MVSELSGRQGQQELHTGSGSDGGGDVHSGLPVQPPHAQGSHWDPFIRPRPGYRGPSSPMRNDDGGSASPGGGQDNQNAVSGIGGRLHPDIDGNRRNDQSGAKRSISGLEEIDDAQLPDVSNGYWISPEEAASGDTEIRIRRQFELLETDPNKLDHAVDLGVDAIVDILELAYLPTSHDDYFKQLALKKDAAVSIITAGLRADENRFRRRNQDILQQLWQRIRADKKLAPAIDQFPTQAVPL